jgi:hypothetical protein
LKDLFSNATEDEILFRFGDVNLVSSYVSGNGNDEFLMAELSVDIIFKNDFE